MAVAPYDPDAEEQMRTLYASLNERDRRRYAAIEAGKLGHGGQSYIRSVLGCDYKTLRRGMEELKSLPELPPGLRDAGRQKIFLRMVEVAGPKADEVVGGKALDAETALVVGHVPRTDRGEGQLEVVRLLCERIRAQIEARDGDRLDQGASQGGAGIILHHAFHGRGRMQGDLHLGGRGQLREGRPADPETVRHRHHLRAAMILLQTFDHLARRGAERHGVEGEPPLVVGPRFGQDVRKIEQTKVVDGSYSVDGRSQHHSRVGQGAAFGIDHLAMSGNPPEGAGGRRGVQRFLRRAKEPIDPITATAASIAATILCTTSLLLPQRRNDHDAGQRFVCWLLPSTAQGRDVEHKGHN